MGTTFLAVLLGTCSAPPAPAQAPPPTPTRAPEESAPTVTVVGNGEATAFPDTAEVRLRLETQAFSAASALRDNASAVAGLRRRLGERGVARKDMVVVNSGVVPQMTQLADPPARPEVSSYIGRSQVRVTVRRLDRLGDVLDDAAGEGAELARDINYSVADPAPHLAQARRRALLDARRRAETYARNAGMEVGEILHIEEQKPDKDGKPANEAEEGEPEAEQTFRASVAVTYALHPKTTKLESKERR
jgi:uncharacterized protein YggE